MNFLVSESIGAFGLYLDADPKAVDFYLKLSFVPLVEIQAERPTPMFLHIETVEPVCTVLAKVTSNASSP
ncbi:MAG: hypothetical protein V4632_11170 [Pseudomonadota bacterium]